jgi:hypothetical protein
MPPDASEESPELDQQWENENQEEQNVVERNP